MPGRAARLCQKSELGLFYQHRDQDYLIAHDYGNTTFIKYKIYTLALKLTWEKNTILHRP